MKIYFVGTVFKPIGSNRCSDRIRFRIRRIDRFSSDPDDIQYTMQLFTSVPGCSGLWDWLNSSYDYYFRSVNLELWEVEGPHQLSLF